MRARSRATRRLVVHLAIALVGASFTVACAADGSSPAAEPAPEPAVVAVTEPQPEPEPAALLVEEPVESPVATNTPVPSLLTTSAMRTVPTEPFLIGNTLGRGMSLRRAPTSADLVKAWPDGTMLEGLGAQQDARGWTWAWVRDPEGNDGWIPTQFLVRSPDEAPAPLPLTPAPPEIPGRARTTERPPVPPTATVAPTSGTLPSSASTAPSGGSQVVAIASRWYSSSGGGINVVGLVENKGSEPVMLEKLAISLLGENGKTVGTINAQHAPRVLQAGEKAPWLAFGSPASAFKDLKVQTETRPFAGSDGERDYTRSFRVEGVSVVHGPPRANPKVSGQVVNTGARAASSVNVLVAVSWPDGSLIDVSHALIMVGNVEPGQSAPFEALFKSGLPAQAQHTVFVEGKF